VSAQLSSRDRTLLSVIGVVVLYAALVLMWFMSQADAWRVARKKYAQAVSAYQKEEKLIGERDKWFADYDAERAKMPLFDTDAKDVDTRCLQRMDALAAENFVAIQQRQSGNEEAVGDVYELPLDVRSWEAGLEPLVKFFYALQSDGQTMFDVRQVVMKPSSRKGFLKGSFTLACAYMRGERDDNAKERP